MAKRKDRLIVLLDTSVLVRIWANPHADSPSTRIWRLWLERRIQIAVSVEVLAEYVEVLDRFGHPTRRIQEFVNRLETRRTVTRASLGRRTSLDRDPKDEPILATAEAARVAYLITLDKDMLEMPLEQRRRIKFEIVTPARFLERIT